MIEIPNAEIIPTQMGSLGRGFPVFIPSSRLPRDSSGYLGIHWEHRTPLYAECPCIHSDFPQNQGLVFSAIIGIHIPSTTLFPRNPGESPQGLGIQPWKRPDWPWGEVGTDPVHLMRFPGGAYRAAEGPMLHRQWC